MASTKPAITTLRRFPRNAAIQPSPANESGRTIRGSPCEITRPKVGLLGKSAHLRKAPPRIASQFDPTGRAWARAHPSDASRGWWEAVLDRQLFGPGGVEPGHHDQPCHHHGGEEGGDDAHAQGDGEATHRARTQLE